MNVSGSFRTAHLVVIVALFAVLGIMALSSASAQAYPPLKPGVVKVDTGDRQEDEQPAWTARLARHGWDYNPRCNRQGARFDWFAPGQSCNERAAIAVISVGTLDR